MVSDIDSSSSNCINGFFSNSQGHILPSQFIAHISIRVLNAIAMFINSVSLMCHNNEVHNPAARQSPRRSVIAQECHLFLQADYIRTTTAEFRDSGTNWQECIQAPLRGGIAAPCSFARMGAHARY